MHPDIPELAPFIAADAATCQDVRAALL